MKLNALPRILIAVCALALVACDSKTEKTAIDAVKETAEAVQPEEKAAKADSETAQAVEKAVVASTEAAVAKDEADKEAGEAAQAGTEAVTEIKQTAQVGNDPVSETSESPQATDNPNAEAAETVEETAPVTAEVKQPLMEEFLEGGHFETLSETQPVTTGDKIEVRELFWYSCPHCATLEPAIENWLHNDKPDNAEYVPMPAVLGNSWALLARAYYTFEALGLLDELHLKMFEAIHDNKMRFNTVEQVADWAATQGADRQMVIDTFDSFAVDTKLRYAQLMTERYGINSVPAVVVDGKYRTNVSLAGSVPELFKVINYLVDLAASERAEMPKDSG